MSIIHKNVSLCYHIRNISMRAFLARTLVVVMLSFSGIRSNAQAVHINVHGPHTQIFRIPTPINTYGLQIESSRCQYQFFIDLESYLLSWGKLAAAHPIATLCAIIATAVVAHTIYYLAPPEEENWCKEKKRSFDPTKWLKDCKKALKAQVRSSH